MAGEISSDGAALVSGAQKADSTLPGNADRTPAAPGVHPGLTAAVDDTTKDGERARGKVKDGTKKTDKFAKGVEDLDNKGAKRVNNAGSMPTVPSSAPQQSAPTAPSPAPMPAPVPATPPAGVTSIDPQILAALIEASRAQAESDGANGIFPHSDDPFAGSSATSPQNPDPLDVSQVSLAKYPGGPLTAQETASVINQALTINGIPDDPALREQWQALYQHMSQGESGGNPNAGNGWDSNATGMIMEDGLPSNSSRGQWQCIPSTFAAYHMAGTSNSIYDPVASASASINYVMDTYNVGADGSGLGAFMSRQGVGTGGYQGY
ncbi:MULTISPECIES: transglycosylase SLT domain-containing protein [Mycobacteriaceae]|jgi:hypothetical protein|uniref:transglycosylase SLT domain-containing protein n=1 Tax=Mycobacteriaceae TaxID=1762 RepID=UPI0009649847|nr:transglycosylase SLT domain-containing protein [Mycobacterium syngnathidarum]OLT97715.1 peptidase [Mycobacterium syngnathidarum]